jgi:hypothetical protein
MLVDLVSFVIGIDFQGASLALDRSSFNQPKLMMVAFESLNQSNRHDNHFGLLDSDLINSNPKSVHQQIMSSIKQPVIIGAVRTPVGKFWALKGFKATQLGALSFAKPCVTRA